MQTEYRGMFFESLLQQNNKRMPHANSFEHNACSIELIFSVYNRDDSRTEKNKLLHLKLSRINNLNGHGKTLDKYYYHY